MGNGDKTKKYSIKTKPTTDSNNDGNCENFVIETRILDPVPSALKGLYVGDVLFIKLNTSVERIELLNSRNEISGKIALYNIDTLVECLKKGVKFIAVIIDIEDDETYDVRIETANVQ
jgi:hypothetical protein